VGVQDLTAHSFATQRSIGTGSWLGRDVQGHGLGTEMRAAALALAFDGLGTVEAHSGYIEGNAASARVSERLGYLANGVRVRRLGPGGEPVTEHLVRVSPAT
jgi:RimJ/RimL family protein N-acetyltransferase